MMWLGLSRDRDRDRDCDWDCDWDCDYECCLFVKEEWRWMHSEL